MKRQEAVPKDDFYQTERRRVFLLPDLPAPLTRAAEHLQFFDNYIENTRLRLRTIRAPQTKTWTWILEQRAPVAAGDFSTWQVSRIFLNEAEHRAFEHFEGRVISRNERAETSELRFNRYFYDYEDKRFEIDVFLNPLWGLYLAKIFFQSAEEMRDSSMPEFAVVEVTQDEFFIGENLVGKTFADVREKVLSGEF